MHQHLIDVLARLDDARANLRTAVRAVPAPLRRQAPGPGRWSVNDVLEHLSLVERRFTGLIAERIEEARATGLGAERDARAVLPGNISGMMGDRTNRRTAPDPVQPRGLSDDEAWDAVDRARASLRATLTAADGLALSQVIHTHPAFGSLNAYQWAELIAAHEARHTQQIVEIARHHGAAAQA